MARPRKPRPAELVHRLERFAAEYERKLSRLDAERDKLKAQRDNQMPSAARHRSARASGARGMATNLAPRFADTVRAMP